ncbi:uncharacterized protein LOC110869607 [Helianthus annuus]|uniref:uncharacterized protein LOC110869607 n=1 Tax=Helianthus annuus TaxID=4232 RepID=UPI000B8FE230|nr:uncharacterized protein LOC110869607 [Helianthus annuus]
MTASLKRRDEERMKKNVDELVNDLKKIAEEEKEKKDEAVSEKAVTGKQQNEEVLKKIGKDDKKVESSIEVDGADGVGEEQKKSEADQTQTEAKAEVQITEMLFQITIPIAESKGESEDELNARGSVHSRSQNMPPRRDLEQDAAIAALVAQQIAAVLPNLVTQINQANNNNNNALCSFKTFNSAKPLKFSGNPTTVRQAIELAATLTESQVRKGKLARKGDKKQLTDTVQDKGKCKGMGKKGESSRRSRKRKASQNFAVTAQNAQNPPAQPPAKKQYAGTAPHCNRCNGHHTTQQACKQCTTCGKLGHTTNICRLGHNQAAQNPAQVQGNAARFPPGSCYNCGEMCHFQNNCPRLANPNANANVNANPARGRAYNLNANEARADNEVVNELN